MGRVIESNSVFGESSIILFFYLLYNLKRVKTVETADHSEDAERDGPMRTMGG